VRRLAVALACGALALAPVACGGDDEPEATDTTTTPELTVPSTAPDVPTDTTPAPAPTQTTPPADTGSGGTTAPPASKPQDSPENDSPAPKGSPAEKFEKFCDENPGACG
jgi:hypothetical protein